MEEKEKRLRIGQAYLEGFNSGENCFLSEIERYIDDEAEPDDVPALKRLLAHLNYQDPD
jgi:hypothetical protein